MEIYNLKKRMKQDLQLFFAEFARAVKLLKIYPIDTINNIISFIILSIVFMIGIFAFGDSSQVFGVIFFPVMLNLISGPSASIRNDIELGVFEQVYISSYSLKKISVIRTIVSGLTSLLGSVLIALIIHFFFSKITISFLNIVFILMLFCFQSILIGIILSAITIRFRKAETLLNIFNILIMIELVLPLNNTLSVVGNVPMLLIPFYGVVVLYQQMLMGCEYNVICFTVFYIMVNTVLMLVIAKKSYNVCMKSAKMSGSLGQY